MDIEVRPIEMIDPHHVHDIVVSGIGEIEDVDGGDRFTLYARQVIDGRETCIVVARVVVPTGALPAILFLAARHIGLSLVKAAQFISGTVH